jgi:hypothetical protein
MKTRLRARSAPRTWCLLKRGPNVSQRRADAHVNPGRNEVTKRQLLVVGLAALTEVLRVALGRGHTFIISFACTPKKNNFEQRVAATLIRLIRHLLQAPRSRTSAVSSRFLSGPLRFPRPVLAAAAAAVACIAMTSCGGGEGPPCRAEKTGTG